MKKILVLCLIAACAKSFAFASARPTIHTFRNETSLMQRGRLSRNEIMGFIHHVLAMIERRQPAQSYAHFFDGENFSARLDRAGVGPNVRGVVAIRSGNDFTRWYNGFIDDYREIILTVNTMDIDFLTNGAYQVSFTLTFQGRNSSGNFVSNRFRQEWVLTGENGKPVIRSITSRSSPTRFVTQTHGE